MNSRNIIKNGIIPMNIDVTTLSYARFHPHTLLPKGPAFTEEGIREAKLNFLQKNKIDSENVYLLEIPHVDICQRDFLHLEKHIQKFFTNKNYLNPFNYNTHFQFAKFCWLSSEFIKDGKFRSYIGAHYNPRLKQVVIHPGSQRYKVVRLFEKTPSKFLFWNTNGVIYNWMSKEQPIPLDKDNEIFKKYDFGLTPDHGSIIPHFCLQQDGSMDDSSIKYFNKVQSICKKLKLKANLEYNIIKDFISNDNYNCEVVFKNDDRFTLWKGIALIFGGTSYEDEDIMVKVNI